MNRDGAARRPAPLDFGFMETKARSPQHDFHLIIQAACRAPSADNNQPWAFGQSGDSIQVHHRRDRAVASDVCDMFSWIALGAAIENMALFASAIHLAADVDCLPRPFAVKPEGEHVATVRFADGGPADPLAQFIQSRVTNRRPYDRKQLPEEDLAALAQAASAPGLHLSWLRRREELGALARLVAIADRVRFEHEPFHDEIHRVLRYSEEEAAARGDGLSLRSLEIPEAAGPLLRGLRPWWRMRLANLLGMSRLLGRLSRNQVINSGAIGLLAIEERSDRSYIQAGRAFERLWLAATARRLSLQPLGSLPLFLTRLVVQRDGAFSTRHAGLMRLVAEQFHELFPGARERPLVMLFRIGRASRPPSARSFRHG